MYRTVSMLVHITNHTIWCDVTDRGLIQMLQARHHVSKTQLYLKKEINSRVQYAALDGMFHVHVELIHQFTIILRFMKSKYHKNETLVDVNWFEITFRYGG